MENWNKVPLGEVLNYEQPTKYIVETTNYNDSYETPVLTAGKSFILGYTNEKKGIFTNVPAIIFDDFTTAFHYVDFPFKVKSSAMKILKADKEKADLRFLYYRMSKIPLDTDLHKRYWISKFSKAQIQLPPLETQKNIAQILDDAASLRLKTEQILKEYDLLAQSLFLDMFGDPVINEKGWEIVDLINLCKKITDGTHQGPKFIESGIPFLLVSNIVNNEMNFETKKFISDAEYKTLTKSTKIEVGDLLYSSVGSYGNPAIVLDDRKFCFQRHIAHLKPNHSIVNIIFLHAMMSSPIVTRQADRYAVGVAQKTLNLKVIKAFKVFSPPIVLQNQFAEKIALIEKQKELTKQELKESKDLFNCLLQKAFKGESV